MSASDLRERVLAAVQREVSPPRAVVGAMDVRRIGVALLVSLGVFAAVNGVRVGDRPLSLLAMTALGAAAFTVIVGVVAMAPGRSMLGRPRVLLWSIAAATPIVLLTWKLTWTARFDVLGPMRVGLKCLGLSLAMAAAPMFVFVGARLRSDPLHPAATGAAIGAAVGAMAWVLVDLWCPIGHLGHLLVGHVLPLAVIIVAGGLLGRQYVALRTTAAT
jgi:hypothetical protein